MVVFRKDIFTEEYLRHLGLNERQIKAVMYVKENNQISNKIYQEINKTTKRIASRDLTILVSKGVFRKTGVTGKGTLYVLRGHKGDIWWQARYCTISREKSSSKNLAKTRSKVDELINELKA